MPQNPDLFVSVLISEKGSVPWRVDFVCGRPFFSGNSPFLFFWHHTSCTDEKMKLPPTLPTPPTFEQQTKILPAYLSPGTCKSQIQTLLPTRFNCIEDGHIKSISAFGDHRCQQNGPEENSTICVGLLKVLWPHKRTKNGYLPHLLVDTTTPESVSQDAPKEISLIRLTRRLP